MLEVSKQQRYSLSSSWTTCFSRGELKLIEVQVMIRNGIPRFDIIGLPQNVIREGKDRILSALSQLGVELPAQKILVSLNPGDLQKEGSHFDLPIFIAILQALGLTAPSEPYSFYWGELGLDGSIRTNQNLLPHLLFANSFSPRKMIYGTPADADLDLNFLFPFLNQCPISLSDISQLFDAPENPLVPIRIEREEIDRYILSHWIESTPAKSRWESMMGSPHQFLFWCLMILGRHHVFLEGPPGVGKSSWCMALEEIHPPLSALKWNEKFQWAVPAAKIDSLNLLYRAPFESPHHSSSRSAIIGGGSGFVASGAITRAHLGILFMDEFAEFSRDVLESLREPLENKTLTVGRTGILQKLPADIQLLAAMNPCRCGNYGSPQRCVCTTLQFGQYRSKISGPLRDRFHIRTWWRFEDGIQCPKEFSLKSVRSRIAVALRRPFPTLDNLFLPKHLSPRRQQRWLETLITWSQWHDISQVTRPNFDEFQNFFLSMEDYDDRDNLHHQIGAGKEFGIHGATDPRIHMVS